MFELSTRDSILQSSSLPYNDEFVTDLKRQTLNGFILLRKAKLKLSSLNKIIFAILWLLRISHLSQSIWFEARILQNLSLLRAD